MKIFLRCVAGVSAILLALYPLGLHGSSTAANVCAGAGLLVAGAGLVLRRAWTGALAATFFCAEYLIVLIAGSIALDPFVLIEAILVFVMLETTDLAAVRADRIDVAVLRNRFGFMAGALIFGGTIGLLVLSFAPALVAERNPALLVTGAVAALCAGIGVLVAARRAS
jgi:hypothetical protein